MPLVLCVHPSFCFDYFSPQKTCRTCSSPAPQSNAPDDGIRYDGIGYGFGANRFPIFGRAGRKSVAIGKDGSVVSLDKWYQEGKGMFYIEMCHHIGGAKLMRAFL